SPNGNCVLSASCEKSAVSSTDVPWCMSTRVIFSACGRMKSKQPMVLRAWYQGEGPGELTGEE
ncbi:unnamed protein product, partial [Mycena citricolor]